MQQPHILDVLGAAELLGCSERSVHVLRKRPDFPRPVALFGVHRARWRREDLIEWIRHLPAVDAVPAPDRLLRGKAAKRESAEAARNPSSRQTGKL